jgi:hypothetical protein
MRRIRTDDVERFAICKHMPPCALMLAAADQQPQRLARSGPELGLSSPLVDVYFSHLPDVASSVAAVMIIRFHLRLRCFDVFYRPSVMRVSPQVVSLQEIVGGSHQNAN